MDASQTLCRRDGETCTARPREACRSFACRWLQKDTVFLAANASNALDQVASLTDGPVILTDAAHDALLRPWMQRSVRWWRCNSEGALDLETLTPLLDASVKVVCLPAASNVSGRVYDVATIIQCVSGRPAPFNVVVDAVAYAPHRRPVFADADAVVVGIPQVFWTAPGLLRAVAAVC